MGIEYKKIKLDELRKLIVEDSMGQISQEDVELIKGKGSKDTLIELHKTLVDDPDDPDELSVPKIEESEPEPEISRNDKIMSMFKSDELVKDDKGKKNPNIYGLRRVTEELYGISKSGPIDFRHSDINSSEIGKCIVLYEIILDSDKQYSALASSWIGNTDDEFAVFPEACAETRAEGRALRKALGIKNVCSDELTKKDTTEYITPSHGVNIDDFQMKAINTMCKRMNIDVNKFINNGKNEYKSISVIPYQTAVAMLTKLNEYQGPEGKIPENIIGEKV